MKKILIATLLLLSLQSFSQFRLLDSTFKFTIPGATTGSYSIGTVTPFYKQVMARYSPSTVGMMVYDTVTGKYGWQSVGSGGMTNPLTTTGDMIYSSSGTTPARRGIGSQGQILQVSNGLPEWKYDTTTLVTFSAGARFQADTALFTDSTLYGSFYLDGNDTLIITKIRAVMNGGTSDTLGIKISFNDTINVDGTRIKTADIAINSTTTGNETTSFDNPKIPPGNWVWLKSPAVVAGRKPYYLSVSIIGYKKRVN